MPFKLFGVRFTSRLAFTTLVLALAMPGPVTAQQADAPGPAQLSPADSGSELASRLEALPSPIVNGVLDHGSPSVGLFLNGGGVCTGTLIGCRTFLTAAHCVCGEDLGGAECSGRQDLTDPSNKLVFFQHIGAVGVAEVAVHPDFEFGQGSDLAILRLEDSVPGVRPSRINQTSRPTEGSLGAIVGFGLTEGSANNPGLKRTGLVETASCLAVPNGFHLCWNFLEPLGAPGTNSSICQGDSGGPLFVDFGEGPRVAGVASGGRDDCLPPNFPAEADVFVDRTWIQSVAGADLHRTDCGSLPFAGDPAAPFLFGSEVLSPSTPQARFNFEVPPGVDLLVATLNGSLVEIDADLFLRRGASPTSQAFDCKSDTAGLPLEVCGIPSPPSGTWHLLAQQAAGAGPFQVTVTLFEESAGNGDTSPCVEGEFTLCAVSDRFEITATAPRSRYDGLAGRVSPVIEGDLGGAFHYFRAEKNFHTVVKIGLRPSGYYAVSSVALDPLEWTVRVRDTLTGEVKTYDNPQGGLGYGTDVKAFKKDP